MTRLLVVEDVEQMRDLLRTAVGVRGGFDLVGEAASAREALSFATGLRPEVVLLDLALPDTAGARVLSALRAAVPGVKVVVFSAAERADLSWLSRGTDQAVDREATLDRLLDVLQAVAGSTGPTDRTLDLPGELASVTLAREFVGDTLVELRAEEVLDAAYLVVSELAANAVLHARTRYRVDVHVSGRGVRVAVADRGPGTPEPRDHDATSESGRGLHLVSALSSAWGIESSSTHKTVWAQLARA